MNTIAEQLWNYIDGHCDEKEQLAIESKIASDLQYSILYKELLAVHHELNQLDLEEPSMSFTRNVMEQVNLELRPVALKTKVNNRIIYVIGAFFVLSLLLIFGYAISISDFNFDFKMPETKLSLSIDKMINPTFLKVFLLVDAVLALLYLDSFLRKGKINTQKKGA